MAVIPETSRAEPPSLPWRKILVAAAAWGAAIFALVYFPDREDGSGAMFAGLAGFGAVALGLAALERARVLPPRSPADHARLLLYALALGALLGLANLGANAGLATLDPVIRHQMITRWADFSPWSVVISGPILEEILFRVGLLGGLAWLVGRLTGDRRTAFLVALVASSVLFGVAHIFYGGVDEPLYRVGMALKSSSAGLLLGWIFWRWGLPYSIVSHCTANLVHLMLMSLVF